MQLKERLQCGGNGKTLYQLMEDPNLSDSKTSYNLNRIVKRIITTFLSNFPKQRKFIEYDPESDSIIKSTLKDFVGRSRAELSLKFLTKGEKDEMKGEEVLLYPDDKEDLPEWFHKEDKLILRLGILTTFGDEWEDRMLYYTVILPERYDKTVEEEVEQLYFNLYIPVLTVSDYIYGGRFGNRFFGLIDLLANAIENEKRVILALTNRDVLGDLDPAWFYPHHQMDDVIGASEEGEEVQALTEDDHADHKPGLTEAEYADNLFINKEVDLRTSRHGSLGKYSIIDKLRPERCYHDVASKDSDCKVDDIRVVHRKTIQKMLYGHLADINPSLADLDIDEMTVGIHFRGSDYCYERFREAFPVLGLTYYKKGLEALGVDSLDKFNIVVFSHPMDTFIVTLIIEGLKHWFPTCKFYHESNYIELISGPPSSRAKEGKIVKNSFDLISLMGKMPYLIISNSSLSFWGGYLSSGKIIVAPTCELSSKYQHWFKEEACFPGVAYAYLFSPFNKTLSNKEQEWRLVDFKRPELKGAEDVVDKADYDGWMFCPHFSQKIILYYLWTGEKPDKLEIERWVKEYTGKFPKESSINLTDLEHDIEVIYQKVRDFFYIAPILRATNLKEKRESLIGLFDYDFLSNRVEGLKQAEHI